MRPLPSGQNEPGGHEPGCAGELYRLISISPRGPLNAAWDNRVGATWVIEVLSDTRRATAAACARTPVHPDHSAAQRLPVRVAGQTMPSSATQKEIAFTADGDLRHALKPLRDGVVEAPVQGAGVLSAQQVVKGQS